MKLIEIPQAKPLELWAGVECTINRVRDRYQEQLDRTGHTRRLSDFELFASLGIKALRHPVLWERVAPRGAGSADWTWADASLQRILELGIRPIVGLVHHGSGPESTSLLDPEFPGKLAAYARSVAERYPWVRDYTPVNEPLTTARFSCLYGHWYPHAKDDRSFVRALVNECRAVVLCMRAVREVNPSARLIQTDDLGKVFSTPKLAYQAEFENERRWLTYDLLCGRVDRDHAMWDYLLWTAGEAELHWFLENTCPPDVMGINHYLSGERYLDHEYERYPDCTHGGNGREQYADVLAARVRDEGAAGPQALLMEAWKRYGRPIAVTECHNGCTREEQLRWFLEVWQGAQNARRQGVNVIAVTAWSLLGAFDWDHLVTRNDQHYESGVYDIRSTPLRPTALAPLIRDLAAQKRPDHPLLGVAGWWKRSQRLIYGFSRTDAGELKLAGLSHRFAEQMQPGNVPPVLITGSRGTLGYAFARICATRGIPYRLLSREDLDIADGESVCRTIGELAPWAVINAAGYVRVDDAEQQWVRCYRENTLGPAVLAFECGRRNIQLMTFSSDLVFGGTNTRPYVESDDTAPLSFYGLSKAEAEQRVLKALPSALIVRSSAFFGPWDEHNFVLLALRTLALNQEFRAAADAMVSPTYVPDLVNGCLDLLIDGESGIWHVANEGEISWATLAETAAEHAKVPTKMLVRCELQDLKLPARRPRYSVLGSQRALLLPKLDDALRRFMVECEKTWNPTRYESNERLAA